MKTALFFPTYLSGQDERGSGTRLQRAIKYLHYYTALMPDLGIERIYVSVNGGNGWQIGSLLSEADPNITVIRRPYVARGKGHPEYDCLPNWRAMYDYQIPIADGFEKLIITDDDAFILSQRFIDHIWMLQSGWEVYWCPKYGFPEGAINVLCKDTFPAYLDYVKTPYEQRNKCGQPAELMVPFGKVNKDFKIDRWGETRTPQEPWMDGYCQCPGDLPMVAKMGQK